MHKFLFHKRHSSTYKPIIIMSLYTILAETFIKVQMLLKYYLSNAMFGKGIRTFQMLSRLSIHLEFYQPTFSNLSFIRSNLKQFNLFSSDFIITLTTSWVIILDIFSITEQEEEEEEVLSNLCVMFVHSLARKRTRS